MATNARKSETDQAIERLAKFIAGKESLNYKTLDEALRHRSKWERIVPEAKEMLEAAYPVALAERVSVLERALRTLLHSSTIYMAVKERELAEAALGETESK